MTCHYLLTGYVAAALEEEHAPAVLGTMHVVLTRNMHDTVIPFGFINRHLPVLALP